VDNRVNMAPNRVEAKASTGPPQQRLENSVFNRVIVDACFLTVASHGVVQPENPTAPCSRGSDSSVCNGPAHAAQACLRVAAGHQLFDFP
jgi:hypothetical protein